MAMLSILTLYNYDPSIFNGFRVPDHLNKQTVINKLCLDLAELSLLYSAPDVMKQAIATWTDVHYKEWCDLQETLEYEYNPIWNVDGTVKETHNLKNVKQKSGKDSIQDSGTDSISNTGSDTVANSGNDVSTNSGQDTVTNSGTDSIAHTGTDTTTNSVTGYNSSSYTAKDKSELAHGLTDTTTHGLTQTTTHGLSNTLAHGLTQTTTYNSGSGTTYGKKQETTYGAKDEMDDTGTLTTERSGNIGVTSTQSLIQEQRKVVQFNVAEFIIKQFKNQFCIMVY